MKTLKPFRSTLFFLCCLLLWVTSIQAQLARPNNVLTVAIVPCAVVYSGMPQSEVLSPEAYVREGSTSGALQRNLYLYMTEYLEANPKSTIQLQAVTDTNILLELNGITLRESWKMGAPELMEVLGVDAVLRVSVAYATGSVTRISGTGDNPGAPNCDNGVLMIPSKTIASAMLLEGKLGYFSPIWRLGNHYRRFRRGRGNKAIARRIIRRLTRNLSPYQNNYLFAQNE
ncbi:MAG: hypothetical protein AAFP77_09650 [Bacteroidota bacterium]